MAIVFRGCYNKQSQTSWLFMRYLSSSSRVQKSKIKVLLARPHSYQWLLRENLLLPLFQFLLATGIPWLVVITLQSLLP